MTQRTRDERVEDELVRAARSAEPPPPTAAHRDAQIYQAILEGERRIARERAERRSSSRPRWQVMLGGLALAAAALLTFQLTWPSPSPRGRIESVSLATGDRVTRTSTSEVEFARVTEESRVISVHAGEALFDVVPLAREASFVVQTEELEVSVRGTVFTVSREAGVSLVHVFEGRVEVREGEARTLVAAGQRYASGQGVIAATSPVALQAEGEAARLARERGPHLASAPSEPAPEPELSREPEVAPTEPVPRAETHTVAEPVSEPATELPPRHPVHTRVDLEARVASRDFEGALAEAQRVLQAHPHDSEARLVEAQALQGLRRFDAAATAYDALARTGPSSLRAEAAFRAATLRYQDLHDARGGLASLEAVDLAASPYAERALGLRARCQHASGDVEAAHRSAERYLTLFPEGGMQQAMQALLQ